VVNQAAQLHHEVNLGFLLILALSGFVKLHQAAKRLHSYLLLLMVKTVMPASGRTKSLVGNQSSRNKWRLNEGFFNIS
jgi:hypothetical protein